MFSSIILLNSFYFIETNFKINELAQELFDKSTFNTLISKPSV